MKIVLPGGSGQVGTILARWYQSLGHDVVVLSRAPAIAPWRVLQWDAVSLGAWSEEISGADVVINLAGRNVNCRYTPTNRHAIMHSRVQSTEAIGRAILQAAHPPPVWLQSSTATIYDHRFDAPNDEYTGHIGVDQEPTPASWHFSRDVAQAWERAATATSLPHTRVVLLRSAMIMSADRDGIFDTLLGLVKVGLGGTAGDGMQYLSWITDVDFCRAVDWIVTHPELDGAVNVCAPNPLPNAAFMRDIREAWGVPIGLPAMPWMLEIGALLMNTETELVLKSRRVVPTRLLESGFVFEQPVWRDAVKTLCGKLR